MAEQRPFDKFMPRWMQWVDARRAIWSHVHVAGLLVWARDGWTCVTSTIVLAADNRCQTPHGVDPNWERQVCAFRVALPLSCLQTLIDGLAVGTWPDSILPGVSGQIRLSPLGGKHLEPGGEPRLEDPGASVESIDTRDRWTRFTIDLQGPQLHEWHGSEYYHTLEALDRKLLGVGHAGLAELAGLFGCFRGSGEHVSSLWNRQTATRLVAPAMCRLDAVRWIAEESKFVASVTTGVSIPDGRLKIVLHSPHQFGFQSPVAIPAGVQSATEVLLSSIEPNANAEVRLLLFEEVIQSQRAGMAGALRHDLPFAGDMTPFDVVQTPPKPGGWRRERLLASGGQGNVYLARRNGQTGALKEILNHRSDPVRVTRLRREIGFLRRFARSPFLVPVLDSSPDDAEEPYLVMELAPLGSAEDQKKALKGDVLRVLRLVRDIGSGLRELHESAIVHRDTKPKNILMFSLDRAVLADLGVACDVGQTSVTTVAEPVNSQWFSPPEWETGGRPMPTYDILMLGKTLYYLLTGGEKFRDSSFLDPECSVERVVGKRAGRAINRLLAGLLALDPTARFQSMAEVLLAVDETTILALGGGESRG